MKAVRISTEAQREAAYEIRRRVFVDEQGVPPEEERDDLDEDPTTVHVLVLRDGADPLNPTVGEAVGTGRLLAPGADGHPHIGRVAVLRQDRGNGVGRAVMAALEGIALEVHGGDRPLVVALAAQEQAIPFYESIGYRPRGERFLDAGIWHREARKALYRSDGASDGASSTP